MLYHCEKLSAFVYGVDYSDEAISIAKNVLKNSPNARIIKADCINLPFKDGFFDRVFIGDLIEHLSFKKGVRLLKETNRVLMPEGMLLLHTSPNLLFMNILYPFIINLVNSEKKDKIIQHVNIQKKVHIHEYHYFSLKKLAKISGIQANVWIDSDFLRGGTFRYLKGISRPQIIIIRLVGLLERYCGFPIKLLLCNDLWLKYEKK
jgi:ubiquinone/menaquinone biosynthesis C-methylase UbiE